LLQNGAARQQKCRATNQEDNSFRSHALISRPPLPGIKVYIGETRKPTQPAAELGTLICFVRP
jgi:hypothetical protein